MAAEALNEAPATQPTHKETDIVPGESPAHGGGNDPGQGQAAKVRKNRPGQQHRLTGDRNARPFQHDADEDSSVSEAGEEVEEPRWHNYYYKKVVN
jgi:hypothetical protein